MSYLSTLLSSCFFFLFSNWSIVRPISFKNAGEDPKQASYTRQALARPPARRIAFRSKLSLSSPFPKSPNRLPLYSLPFIPCCRDNFFSDGLRAHCPFQRWLVLYPRTFFVCVPLRVISLIGRLSMFTSRCPSRPCLFWSMRTILPLIFSLLLLSFFVFFEATAN